MSLPILQSHRAAASHDDLLRFYHRTELHWSRHLGEETTLDVGSAITNPQLPDEANMVLDLTLPVDLSPEAAMVMIDEHFKSQNTRCMSYVFAPGLDQQDAPLREYLIGHGFTAHSTDIMYLAGRPSGPIAEAGDLTIIPARASFKHYRTLAEEGARQWNRPQSADAAMLHLDDPHVDALLALRDGVAAASITVLAVGEIGCIETLYVSAPFRNQEIGRTMMSRAMEICARSLFKHVFLTMDASDPTAKKLYESFGFQKIGEYVAYHPRA